MRWAHITGSLFRNETEDSRPGVHARYILPSNFLLLSGVLSANADSSPSTNWKNWRGTRRPLFPTLLRFSWQGLSLHCLLLEPCLLKRNKVRKQSCRKRVSVHKFDQQI